MMVRKKFDLIIYWCIAICSVVLAVKPPGYVEPPKIEEKNPPKYAYNYAITGEDKGVQGHQEVRNGINTTGNYFVKTGDAQSDVSYFSDDWGFHPVARYELKSENSHVSSHFALGKEAVDALNDNKDGRFPVPQEETKSNPTHSGPSSSSRPILPTKLPNAQPQFIQFTPVPEQIQFVTPSKPQESELNQPENRPQFPSHPPQNLAYEIVQPQQQIQFIPLQQPNFVPLQQQQQHQPGHPQPNENERPIPTNGHQQNPNLVFLKPDIVYAPQDQPQNAFVSINIHHGPSQQQQQQQQQQIPLIKEQPQNQIISFISTTPKYVTNEDVLNINAAAQPLPQHPNPNEHEQSPSNNPQEPHDKQLNSIAFQHPIVVGEFDFKTPEPIVSTTQASREYLPPLPDKKVNIDLLKIDHNQGQFLKETTASLDVSHQSLEGDQDQHMTDSTSAPQKEAPSRYFLRQFKNRPTVRYSTTTVKYPKQETLVITQRPISNKFLAPVQAGLKLANDDCNDEEEHKKHTQVTKTIVEVQKSVNVIVDDKRPQFGTRYVPRNPCANGFGNGCDTKVIVQPHIIKEQVPVHIQTQKIIEKPVPYPVNHIIEKEVPVYKETVKEVKVPVYVPKPYPVKEIQQVQVPVEKTIIKEVPKIQQVIKEVPVDRPVYVDRHVIHEKIVDRPVIQEKTVVKEVPVVKEVQKIVHVDRPVIQEKIVEKQVPVDRPIYIDRPVEKTVYKEKIVNRPYPVEKIQQVIKEVPVDRPVDRPVYIDRHVVQEKIIDRPYPVEKIKEVIKEVPVQVIKKEFVDRPYPVVQEKIVHVDRPVEKIVHVDRPVEKIVHVDRPVPVEKIVHVPVEKIVEKEVPVEKIVYVDRVQEKIVEKEVPVEKIVHVDRPVEKIIDRPYPVEKIIHVDRPVQVPVEVKVPIYIPQPYPVHVEKKVHVPVPYEKKVFVPVYHEKPLLVKPVHKTNIKTNLFAQQHKVKHVFLDYPMPPPHSHYSYPQINHHPVPIKVEKHISVEKPKFTGYHYEKPSIQLNVDHLFAEKPKAVYADKFSHLQPCIHASHSIKDDYIGPTPFTSDYWATGTRDGITVKRHIENGRSLRIESGGFLPPIEPSTPIDANGIPLKSETSHSK